jgi:Zn-dependent metalloprotease
MTRRSTLLAGALALALTAPQALSPFTASAAPTPDPAGSQQTQSRAERRTDADRGLKRLRADAAGRLRVHRAADGVVDSVSSTDGRAMVEAQDTATPQRTAVDQLARYGETFGLDGQRSRAVVTQTLPSSTGGSVVRADQVVDGVTVFGGQVVLSLDEDEGVVSVGAATTAATEIPAAVVSEARAQQAARTFVAKQHRVRAVSLTVTAQGRRLYDPAIVHTFDPRGTRPVWEFEVTNGLGIRETVLVGTGRGEIALHFNDAPGINRTVCDNNNAAVLSDTQPVPLCTAPARSEGGPASSVGDVNAAYANLGATSDTYQTVGDRDLTAIIGAGSPKALMATVRWCFANATCPYPNAFWNGTQMVFGSGYAGADDVVAHELTHGYVERTSALFTLHQSGALNESLADTIGEVVDHRNNPNPSEDNSAWLLGEDVPGGAIRSMQNPPAFDQPDKMTSPNFANADLNYDDGAVHLNDGVGNKTAYLISQGGTFNGRTVAGIDGADAGLAKTGRLYLEVIPRLTSGSEYADLGRVLASTCEELVASSTAGFTAADCTSVREAVLATELAKAPADPGAAAPEAAITCPTRYFNLQGALRDDDDIRQFTVGFESLWQRTPDNSTPTWAHSGTGSFFGWNPDPAAFGDPSQSSATVGPFVVPAGKASVMSFHHAYAFEYAPEDGGLPAEYYDGGQVLVQVQNGDGSWTTQGSLPWTNGATRTLLGSTAKVFGGDSRGYGSSVVNLTSLAGRTVRVLFKVVGDQNGSLLGWFVDDLRLNTCASRVPSGTALTSVRTSGNAVALTWKPASYAGSGVTGYRIVTGAGTTLRTLPSTARSVTVTGLNARARVALYVRPANAYGEVGSGGGVTIYPTSSYVTTSVAKARKNKAFVVTARVAEATRPYAAPAMPVVLQRRLATSSVWTNVISGTTNTRGLKAWAVSQKKATYYRVVARGVRSYFGSTSAARLVRRR